MTISLKLDSNILPNPEQIDVLPAKKTLINPLSRHITYENDAATEKPREFKKSSSERLNGVLDTFKLTNHHVANY